MCNSVDLVADFAVTAIGIATVAGVAVSHRCMMVGYYKTVGYCIDPVSRSVVADKDLAVLDRWKRLVRPLHYCVALKTEHCLLQRQWYIHACHPAPHSYQSKCVPLRLLDYLCACSLLDSRPVFSTLGIE